MEKEIAEWIDTLVIAEAIFDQLRAYGLEPTYENATCVWLNFLEGELHEGLKYQCQWLQDNQELKIKEGEG